MVGRIYLVPRMKSQDVGGRYLSHRVEMMNCRTRLLRLKWFYVRIRATVERQDETSFESLIRNFMAHVCGE